MSTKIAWPLLVMTFFIPSCTATKVEPPTVERPNLSTRDLSATEKQALTHSLSRTLKDPAAKFQFGPVKYEPGSQTTEYCGLVDSKNSGNQMFHAVLKLDAKGQYSSGEIDDVMRNDATGDRLQKNVESQKLCVAAGYGNLSPVPK